jgi:hypothetical protein
VEAIDRGTDHWSPQGAHSVRELIRECRLPCAINTVDSDPDDPVGRQPDNVAREFGEDALSSGHSPKSGNSA